MAVQPHARISVADFVRHHFESGWRALRGTPLWVWPLPLLLAGTVLLLLKTPVAIITSKPVEEIAGPVVTIIAAVFAFWAHSKSRIFFTLLLACFAATLFLREWHIWGTTKATLVALAALAWWASSRRDEVIPHLRASSAGALLASALWIYVITQILDQHYLLTLGLFSKEGYLSWSDNVEETLETVAHLLVLSAIIVTYRNVSRSAQ